MLEQIRRRYGIDYRTTLAQLIARDASVPASSPRRNVFATLDRPSPIRASPARTVPRRR